MAAPAGTYINLYIIVPIGGRGHLPRLLCSYKYINIRYIATGGGDIPSLILYENPKVGMGRDISPPHTHTKYVHMYTEISQERGGYVPLASTRINKYK